MSELLSLIVYSKTSVRCTELDIEVLLSLLPFNSIDYPAHVNFTLFYFILSYEMDIMVLLDAHE